MPQTVKLLIKRREEHGIPLAHPLITSKQEAQLILLIQNRSKGNYVSANVLRAAGYAVIEAEDGLEGAALLNKHHFDLAIANVLLPNLGGIAIAARIRMAWPNMPIILSGDLRPSGAETILKQPMEVLKTPIDIMELLATIKRILAHRKPITPRTFFAQEPATVGLWEHHASE